MHGSEPPGRSFASRGFANIQQGDFTINQRIHGSTTWYRLTANTYSEVCSMMTLALRVAAEETSNFELKHDPFLCPQRPSRGQNERSNLFIIIMNNEQLFLTGIWSCSILSSYNATHHPNQTDKKLAVDTSTNTFVETAHFHHASTTSYPL